MLTYAEKGNQCWQKGRAFKEMPNLADVICEQSLGGVVHITLFVKLVFDIAVDRQTRTHDKTFEGGPEPQPPTGARSTATLIRGSIFAQLMPNLNHLRVPKTEVMGALLVDSGLKNSYTNLYPDWKQIG